MYKVSARTKAYETAGELLKVLSAPARLAIVSELAEQPRYVHELVERLGMSQPLVSQHLRVLRGARLVGVQREGREAVYSLTDQHVAHIVADAVHHSTEDHAGDLTAMEWADDHHDARTPARRA